MGFELHHKKANHTKTDAGDNEKLIIKFVWPNGLWHVLIVEYSYLHSRDCPIFYMRKKVQKDLAEQDKVIQRFGTADW